MKTVFKVTSMEELDDAIDQSIHSFEVRNDDTHHFDPYSIYWALKEGYYEVYDYTSDIDAILSKEQIESWEHQIGKAMQEERFYATNYSI